LKVTLAHPQGGEPIELDRRVVINAKAGAVGDGIIRRLEIEGTNLTVEYIEPKS